MTRTNSFHEKELRKADQKMERKKIYWLSQITGWTLIAVINLIVLASTDEFTWKRIVSWTILSSTGVLLTHQLRNVIKKNNWIALSLKKLIPRVLISSIIIGNLLYGIFFTINYLLGAYEPEQLRFATPLMGVINVSSIVFAWNLIYFSVHYFENYKKAEIESLIWEAAVKDFELKTLKSQLNPHFMFNALNSIRALIEEDPAGAQTAVTKLSNILRYSLKIERSETVTLEDELQTVSDYLALEAIRFEERLKYRLDVEPASTGVMIPPMMIQTLVENGLKHGISKRTQGGEVVITSRVFDYKLIIQIRNSGQINSKDLQSNSGFGINNTKHRLSILYGEDAYFSIKNETHDSVLAELVIPTGGTKTNESFNN